jgi:hypothetical protein
MTTNESTSTTLNALSKNVFDEWDWTYTTYKRREAEDWVDKAPSSETAEALLHWAKDHPFLRVVNSVVPPGIFPEGVAVSLNDIQTNAPRRKRGPRIIDDDIYDAFPQVRIYAPRGCCVLQLQSGGTTTLKTIV